jgi:hypothetical protein
MEDEKFYDIVYEEITAGTRKNGLWLKSLTEAGGDEGKAKIAYIKSRVDQLIKEEKDRVALERNTLLNKNKKTHFTVDCPSCHTYETIAIASYKSPEAYIKFSMVYSKFFATATVTCNNCQMVFHIDNISIVGGGA